MPRLCKTCTHPVDINPAANTAYCANCNKELTPKEVIGSWTFDIRVNQLKAMHSLMRNANDEGIYMSWIYLMPDGVIEEDFRDIALSDESYNECFDLFVKLIQKEGNRW